MGLADFVDSASNDLADAVHSAAAGLELVIDHAVIDEVKRALHHAASEFDDGSFKSAAISVGHFGGSPEGHVLGSHHTRAHDVIEETLKGIVEDLVTFSHGVQKAADYVVDADHRTEGDLNGKLKVVQALDKVVDHSATDAAYDAGRNHHHYHGHHSSHPGQQGGK